MNNLKNNQAIALIHFETKNKDFILKTKVSNKSAYLRIYKKKLIHTNFPINQTEGLEMIDSPLEKFIRLV